MGDAMLRSDWIDTRHETLLLLKVELDLGQGICAPWQPLA